MTETTSSSLSSSAPSSRSSTPQVMSYYSVKHQIPHFWKGLTPEQYGVLLSNCREYRPNIARNEYKYTAILYSYLYSYLYSRKPVCRTGRRADAKLSHSPSFTDKFIDYSSWIINHLLDVLVCSITVYFHSLFVFWLALRARQNTEQLVKIYSDTTNQNI